VAVGFWSHPAYVLVAYFLLYLLSGLGESALMLRRHLQEKRQESLVDVVDEDEAPEDKDQVDDQEVL